MGRLQLAPVAQGLSDFEAKVVTARLGADGILWELRGVVDGVYPLGRIDVLVPVEELEAARHSLLVEVPDLAVTSTFDEPPLEAVEELDDEAPAGDAVEHRPGSRRWWLTAAIALGVAAFAATRLAATVAWFEDDGPADCTGSAQAAAEGLTARCRP